MIRKRAPGMRGRLTDLIRSAIRDPHEITTRSRCIFIESWRTDARSGDKITAEQEDERSD